jgi:hypothetical protein
MNYNFKQEYNNKSVKVQKFLIKKLGLGKINHWSIRRGSTHHNVLSTQVVNIKLAIRNMSDSISI